MNEEYFKKEFSYMFKINKKEPLSLFGFETADGWNNLLYNLLCIVSIIDTNKYIRIVQIKSKFAGLRFNFEWAGPERKITIHDLYVELLHKLPWSIRKFLGNPSKKWDPTYEQIYDIVSLFEQISFKVCEDCGEPASLKNNGHWLYTMCDKCWNKHKITKISEEITNNERLIVSGHLQPEDV